MSMQDTETPHPAPYSKGLLPVFAQLLDTFNSGPVILDPMAGIGRVHALRDYGFETIGVELEPEWASQHPGTEVGDATRMRFLDHQFDSIVVSPAFGNRMADHHKAMDPSHRRTYKHFLGHDLSENNSGGMQWGDAYRNLHVAAWTECHRVLKDEGLFILNIKDHIRQGRRVRVTLWHILTLASLGMRVIHDETVNTRGFKFGANRNLRCPEKVIVFRKRDS